MEKEREMEQGSVVESSRGEKLARTRKAKMDALFAGKKFEITREIHLKGDLRFQTPLGHKGRNGYALKEVGNDDNQFIVGWAVLQHAAKEYDAVKLPGSDKKVIRDPATDVPSAVESLREDVSELISLLNT